MKKAGTVLVLSLIFISTNIARPAVSPGGQDALDDAISALESVRQRLDSIDVQYAERGALFLQNILEGALLTLDLAKKNKLPQAVIDEFQKHVDDRRGELEKSTDGKGYSENYYQFIGKGEKHYFARLRASTREPTYFSIYDGTTSKGFNTSTREGFIGKKPYISTFFSLANCGFVVEGKNVFEIVREYKKKISEMGEVVQEGRNLLHIKIPETEAHEDYEFWLDKSNYYLPQRIIYHRGMVEINDISYETINGAIVPIAGTKVVYGLNQALERVPFSTSTIKIEKIRVNEPTIEVPAFEFPAGTQVWDDNLKAVYVYRGVEPAVESEIIRITSKFGKLASAEGAERAGSTTVAQVRRKNGVRQPVPEPIPAGKVGSQRINLAIAGAGVIAGLLIVLATLWFLRKKHA